MDTKSAPFSRHARPWLGVLALWAATGLIGPATSATPAATPLATALPNLGDGSDLTPAAERRIGDRIVRELYRDPDYLDDLVIADYVQGIWQPLLQAARQRGELTAQLDEAFAWELLLGRDRSVNAFALPGGYFGLHLGLVAVVGSRDELASVLAHELSHVTQRHIARSLSRQSAQAPWVMGALILGMLAASKDAGAAQATVVGSQAAAAQNQLNYSRDMEREADRIGFGLQTQAGFAPQGFVGMFEKLQQSARLNDLGGFPYLRSHPLTTERIADMQARVQQAPPAPAPLAATAEHALVSARARVLANPGVDALRNWQQELQPAHLARLGETAQLGTLYGACFAALQLRDFAQAKALLLRLDARIPGADAASRLVRLLAAEVALAQGMGASALQALPGPSDTSRAALLLRAQAQTLGGQAEAATQALQVWLADHPRDASAWQQLAAANTALGRKVAAVRAEAEFNGAQMNWGAALARLRAAQELSRKDGAGLDPIEAAIVDARARQIEAVVREQAQER